MHRFVLFLVIVMSAAGLHAQPFRLPTPAEADSVGRLFLTVHLNGASRVREYKKAVDVVGAAHQLFPSRHPECVKATLRYGAALSALSRPEEAAGVYATAFREAADSLGLKSPLLLPYYDDMLRCFAISDSMEELRQLIQVAYDVYRARRDTIHTVPHMLTMVGTVLADHHHEQHALYYLNRAEDYLRSHHKTRQWREHWLTTCDYLMRHHEQAGSIDSAFLYVEEMRPYVGENDSTVYYYVHHTRGRYLASLGKEVEAERLFAGLLSYAVTTFGHYDGRVADLQCRLGDIYWNLGRTDDACNAYSDALQVAERYDGLYAWLYHIYWRLGEIAYQREEKDAAVAYFSKCGDLDVLQEGKVSAATLGKLKKCAEM